MKGDDYLVKEISLLYTEFKKMEGHIVQAPNSYLNTLFILNQRRSGGLAEAVPLTVKFGTTLDQIDELRTRLLEYVKAEKREYQPNILTEIRDIVEAYSVNLNVVFFYKSNWQNELLRLQRRNKFICAMMVFMQEIGIEGPRRRIPGATEQNPFYQYFVGSRGAESFSDSRHDDSSESRTDLGPQSGSLYRDRGLAFVSNAEHSPVIGRNSSILRSGSRMSRLRGESISAMSKRVDFSLGMKDVSSGDIMADLGDERSPARIPELRNHAASRSHDVDQRIIEEDETNRREDEETIRQAESRSGNSRSPFGIRRMSTDKSSIKRGTSLVHRNRFFSRLKKKNEGEEEEDLMEQGMADIPEAAPSTSRGDPRSGVVSPQAVRQSTDTGVSDLSGPIRPTTSGGLPSFEDRLRLQYPANGGRQSEEFELKSVTHHVDA